MMAKKENWYCGKCFLHFFWAIEDEYTQEQVNSGEIPEEFLGESYIRFPTLRKEWKEVELWASNDKIEWFPIPSVIDARAEDVCEKCVIKINKSLRGRGKT